MNIIEKLGIENVISINSAYYRTDKSTIGHTEMNNTDIARLWIAAPEMLEALIMLNESVQKIKVTEETEHIYNASMKAFEVIEKATNKSWEQIKEILND